MGNTDCRRLTKIRLGRHRKRTGSKPVGDAAVFYYKCSNFQALDLKGGDRFRNSPNRKFAIGGKFKARWQAASLAPA